MRKKKKANRPFRPPFGSMSSQDKVKLYLADMLGELTKKGRKKLAKDAPEWKDEVAHWLAGRLLLSATEAVLSEPERSAGISHAEELCAAAVVEVWSRIPLRGEKAGV